MSGDVFLLGGQSNMELRIKFVTEQFADEIKKINDSFIRKFDVPVGLIQTAVEGTPVKAWCNEICAWLSDGEEPTGIRYAWKDCPMNICLYGKRGLPVIPFIKE